MTERVVVLDAASGRRLGGDADPPPEPPEPEVPKVPGYLAIDLGASRLAAGIVDLDGEVILRDRVATPARNVWPALTNLVGRVMAANPGEVEPTVCGVTCPGRSTAAPAR